MEAAILCEEALTSGCSGFALSQKHKNRIQLSIMTCPALFFFIKANNSNQVEEEVCELKMAEDQDGLTVSISVFSYVKIVNRGDHIPSVAHLKHTMENKFFHGQMSDLGCCIRAG